MTNHNVDDVAAAYLQTHNAFQELTFLLERKGNITMEELAWIYGEEPTQAVAVVRAEVAVDRAEAQESCSHTAHTDSETLANKGMQSRDLDNGTSARDSAVVRKPLSKAAAAGAYKRALEFLEPRHPWRMYGVTEFVRCLRAEAKAWRHQARNAEREIALLKIELEEARRGAHE
jgi:hypothetical protein